LVYSGGYPNEAKWLAEIIKQHLQDGITWQHPISHIFRQKPDYVAYQNFSLSVSWTNLGPKVLAWIQNKLNQAGELDAHMNWGEFLVGIINLAATTMAFEAYPDKQVPWPHTVLLIRDNRMANKARTSDSACTASHDIANALRKIFCQLQRLSVMAINTEYISTHDNTFTYDLSRKELET
jgi:hypothetical protein